jgi:hypothetical protein
MGVNDDNGDGDDAMGNMDEDVWEKRMKEGCKCKINRPLTHYPEETYKMFSDQQRYDDASVI